MVNQNQGHALPPLPSRLRLSSEFRLLLASSWIAPARFVQHQAEQIEAACRESIDWDVFLALVARHRVLVLHDVLRRVLGPRLPDRIYDRLQARRMETCRTSLSHAAELIRCNQAFRAQGIDVLPMKGIMLSLQLYGDPAMRPARDLDLLVRPECLDAGDQILRKLGYRFFPYFELTPKRKKWILENGIHYCYRHDDHRQLIELHWRLPQWRTEHIAELWSHCQPANWLGASYLNMSDDALLLYLSDHGAQHRWTRIKWLNDVASMLAQDRDFSWENALALAERFDLSLGLAQTGMLVHWLYGFPLPAPLNELAAKETRSVRLATQALDTMQLSERGQFSPLATAKRLVYSTRIRKRLIHQNSIVSGLLPTDVFNTLSLPDSLFWLYFPLRPLLWFYRHFARGRA
jgi:hypothetical protein